MLFFGAIIGAGVIMFVEYHIVFAKYHREHSASLPFPNEAAYFSRLRQTQQEVEDVQEKAMRSFRWW